MRDLSLSKCCMVISIHFWKIVNSFVVIYIFDLAIIEQCESICKHRLSIREGVKKSKWKFKMAFAMKGGRGSRGGLECHIPILKNDFFKNHLESFPDCENVFCT